MGLTSSRGSDHRKQSAVCAVCLNPVFEERLPPLDCQHKLCLKCFSKYSGKSVQKGEKFPHLSQCPVCAELTAFPDSTKLSDEEGMSNIDVGLHQFIPVTSSSMQGDAKVSEQSYVTSSKKRQYQEIRSSAETDYEFVDAYEGVSDSPVPPSISNVTDCMICQNHRPKRKKTEGIVYCFDCTTVLCQKCKDNHNLRPRCRGHMLCPINRETINDLLCRVHQQLAEDYCIECKCVTCAECHFDDHRGHTIRAFTVHDLDESIFSEMEDHKSKNEKFLDSLNSMEKLYFSELQNTRDAVAKSRNEIIEAINTHFNGMSASVDAEQLKTKETIDKIRSSVVDDNTVLNDLIEKGHQLVSPIASIPDLHISDGNELLQDLRKKIPHNKHLLHQPDTFIYIPVEDVKTNYGQLVKVPLTELDRCIELE